MTTAPDMLMQYGGVPVGTNRLTEIFAKDNIWFVDGDYGSASYTGKQPDWAYALISTAVNAVTLPGAVIYVRPRTNSTSGQVWYEDSIDIPLAYPNMSIYGAGISAHGWSGVNVKPSTAGVTDHLIEVAGSGCHLENMYLTLNGGTAASSKSIVHAVWEYGVRTPWGLEVINCWFDSLAAHPSYGGTDCTGAIAIGSANHTRIQGNTFHNCLGGIVLNSVVGNPWAIQILNNIFQGDPDNRDCDLYIVINSVDATGIVIDGNIFADGIPAHSDGGTKRFVYFPLVTAGSGILSNNVFACNDAELLFDEDGTQGVIADNFIMVNNRCEGTASATARKESAGSIVRTA